LLKAVGVVVFESTEQKPEEISSNGLFHPWFRGFAGFRSDSILGFWAWDALDAGVRGFLSDRRRNRPDCDGPSAQQPLQACPLQRIMQ